MILLGPMASLIFASHARIFGIKRVPLIKKVQKDPPSALDPIRRIPFATADRRQSRRDKLSVINFNEIQFNLKVLGPKFRVKSFEDK
jgi:hypothetical protein